MAEMEHDDFANVSWQNDATGHGEAIIGSPGSGRETAALDHANPRQEAGHAQLGNTADAMDLAGVGEATLQCTVTAPIKENDGTKDAYVSYLVTTNVGTPHSLPSTLPALLVLLDLFIFHIAFP